MSPIEGTADEGADRAQMRRRCELKAMADPRRESFAEITRKNWRCDA